MMQPASQIILVGLLALTLGGCAAGSTTAQTPGTSGATGNSAGVAANNPLANIQLGMSKQQVRHLVGAPSAESASLTAKAFIPLYFGNDAHRTTYYYKGMGRVVFADGNVFGGGGNEVIRVDYDPSESGEAH
jgi:hypothetical protein